MDMMIVVESELNENLMDPRQQEIWMSRVTNLIKSVRATNHQMNMWPM